MKCLGKISLLEENLRMNVRIVWYQVCVVPEQLQIAKLLTPMLEMLLLLK